MAFSQPNYFPQMSPPSRPPVATPVTPPAPQGNVLLDYLNAVVGGQPAPQFPTMSPPTRPQIGRPQNPVASIPPPAVVPASPAAPAGPSWWQRASEGQAVRTGPEHTMPYNVLGSLANTFWRGATAPIRGAQQWYNLFTTPEGVAPSAPAGTAPPPSAPMPNPFAASSPQGVGPQLSFDVPSPPQMPLEQVQQYPAPPEPAAAPQPPQITPPDYSAYEKYMQQGMPTADPRDWKKYRINQALLGLALGAQRWDPRSGWGGLLAGAEVGAGAQAMAAREEEMAKQDEFTKAMRDWSLRRAAGAMDIANTKARYGAQNQENQYNWQVGETNRQNKYAEDVYENTRKNIDRVQAGAIDNAKITYDNAVAEYERGMPKIQPSGDGVIITQTKDGKTTMKYQKLKNTAVMGSPEMQRLVKTFGEDSAIVKQHKWGAIFESKDQFSAMDELARETIAGGYGKEVFGENYDVANEAVKQQLVGLGVTPGDPNYPKEWNRLMVQHLMPNVDITNKEMLNSMYKHGNMGAAFLLNSVQ